MDACIMDGRDLNAGSVIGVRRVRNPILLARAVMEKSEHVMLAGKGAERFSREYGIKQELYSYFLTADRAEQLMLAKREGVVALEHKKFGTVGAVALDRHGNVAAATSTGGMVNKKPGRVGDSPIIGAGVFADNKTIAMSATGIGEHFLRTTPGAYMAALAEVTDKPLNEIAELAISRLVEKVDGLGGFIVINAKGEFASAFSTEEMIHGVTTNTLEPQYSSDRLITTATY
jgi:L-asparaginase / beta-aspartyl-peptidase